MTHPTSHQILRYLHGECCRDEADRLHRHLAGCSTCQTEADSEDAFDRRLRRCVEAEPAPPALLDRIRQGIEEAAREESLRRSLRRTRLGMGAAAAVALVSLLALVAPGGLAPGGPSGSAGPAAPAVSVVHGRLVCLECARRGVGLDVQRRCLGGAGNREHVTGLQADDGSLWRFAESGAARPLLAGPDLRGRPVKLEATAYPEIGYLNVLAVHHL